MYTLQDILGSFKIPLDADGRALIIKAYEFSERAHSGQKRVSGDAYIQHCLATAKILAEIGMDPRTVSAGILHDVPEDTSVTLLTIKQEFGEDVAMIIDGITKLGRIKLRGSKEEYFLENLRRMFLAMAVDIRTAIIKLADRLHNMRTLEHLPKEKQLRIANETMEVYAPIANRLGIGEIRGELEDLAFKYLDPENYTFIKNLAHKRYKETEQYVVRSITDIKDDLKKAGIDVLDAHGRAKRLYSLFRKLKTHDMDIDNIYDFAAVRITVPEIADCYEALGIIHKKYRPMVGRIKDYISLPKPNGYQSLHTTIFGPEGRIIEIQIRTPKMHAEAEFGIAAHWFYSEKEKRGWWRNYFSALQQKKSEARKELEWVSQLREWQKDVGRNDQEFMEGLKIDFFKNHIFAFTPKGDIIDLPEDATPIDFAYAIHSEIGNRAVGAKADRKMVTLDSHIANGQVIEILTSKEHKLPSRDWLRFVKTSSAKSHIRRQLKKEGLL